MPPLLLEPASKRQVIVCHLGRIPYADAWTLQQNLQNKLIWAKKHAPPIQLPHILLLVEHPHVYTLGKSGHAGNLLLSEERLAEVEATFFRIDRGGDITYHGPGQLVGYPILDLDRFFTDLGKYLRLLEEAIIQTCADHNLLGGRVSGRTGVWVGPDEHGPERKICAMGIRCSRWVSMHGFAFNLNTNLDYFSYIVPCGIRDRGVTSVASETGTIAPEELIRTQFVTHFSSLFEAETIMLKYNEAQSFLSSFLAYEPTNLNQLETFI